MLKPGKLFGKSSGHLSVSTEIVACDGFLITPSSGLLARYAENGDPMWSIANNLSYVNITLNPIIYDRETKEIYLPSNYGNKK